MVSRKILVTGGAGYIGGSIIAALLAPRSGEPVQPSNIIAVVRNGEHAVKMAKLGIQIVNAALADGPAVETLILENDIDVVVHCASAVTFDLARPLIEALGKQKLRSEREVYFIHTSGSSGYSEQTGWTLGRVRDTDPVHDMEKENPVKLTPRDTNIAVVELAEQLGVTASLVVPPFIYGEGAGKCGRQTFVTPAVIKSAIKSRAIHDLSGSKTWPAVYIDDLIDLYIRLIQRVFSGPSSASTVSGHWFPKAHEIVWQDMTSALAKAMHARGLVDDSTPSVWTSDEAAAESLGWPAALMPIIYRQTSEIIPVRGREELGWEPKWNNKMFLENLGKDVDAFLRLS